MDGTRRSILRFPKPEMALIIVEQMGDTNCPLSPTSRKPLNNPKREPFSLHAISKGNGTSFD